MRRSTLLLCLAVVLVLLVVGCSSAKPPPRAPQSQGKVRNFLTDMNEKPGYFFDVEDPAQANGVLRVYVDSETKVRTTKGQKFMPMDMVGGESVRVWIAGPIDSIGIPSSGRAEFVEIESRSARHN